MKNKLIKLIALPGPSINAASPEAPFPNKDLVVSI
jgi:hypothetical protein